MKIPSVVSSKLLLKRLPLPLANGLGTLVKNQLAIDVRVCFLVLNSKNWLIVTPIFRQYHIGFDFVALYKFENSKVQVLPKFILLFLKRFWLFVVQIQITCEFQDTLFHLCKNYDWDLKREYTKSVYHFRKYCYIKFPACEHRLFPYFFIFL